MTASTEGQHGGRRGRGDPRSEDVGPLASGAYSFRARFAGDDNYNAVPGSDVDCEPLSVRTFGKTMGFWGNRTGRPCCRPTSDVTARHRFAATCYIVVNTKAELEDHPAEHEERS